MEEGRPGILREPAAALIIFKRFGLS